MSDPMLVCGHEGQVWGSRRNLPKGQCSPKAPYLWTGRLSGSGVTSPSSLVAGRCPGQLHLGPSFV